MTIIDPILLVLLFFFALRGYFKGLFREAFSLLGLLVGFVIAVRYDEAAAVFWSDYWKLSFIVLKALAFIALFFVVYFAFNLLGWVLNRSAKVFFLQAFNRVGGVVVGAGKGAVVLAVIVFLLSASPFTSQKMLQKMKESYLVPTLNRFGQEIIRIGRANLFPPEDSEVRNRKGVGVF